MTFTEKYESTWVKLRVGCLYRTSTGHLFDRGLQEDGSDLSYLTEKIATVRKMGIVMLIDSVKMRHTAEHKVFVLSEEGQTGWMWQNDLRELKK